MLQLLKTEVRNELIWVRGENTYFHRLCLVSDTTCPEIEKHHRHLVDIKCNCVHLHSRGDN